MLSKRHVLEIGKKYHFKGDFDKNAIYLGSSEGKEIFASGDLEKRTGDIKMIVFSPENLRIENSKQIPDISGTYFVWNFLDFEKGCPELMNDNYKVLSGLISKLHQVLE